MFPSASHWFQAKFQLWGCSHPYANLTYVCICIHEVWTHTHTHTHTHTEVGSELVWACEAPPRLTPCGLLLAKPLLISLTTLAIFSTVIINHLLSSPLLSSPLLSSPLLSALPPHTLSPTFPTPQYLLRSLLLSSAPAFVRELQWWDNTSRPNGKNAIKLTKKLAHTNYADNALLRCCGTIKPSTPRIKHIYVFTWHLNYAGL